MLNCPFQGACARESARKEALLLQHEQCCLTVSQLLLWGTHGTCSMLPMQIPGRVLKVAFSLMPSGSQSHSALTSLFHAGLFHATEGMEEGQCSGVKLGVFIGNRF